MNSAFFCEWLVKLLKTRRNILQARARDDVIVICLNRMISVRDNETKRSAISRFRAHIAIHRKFKMTINSASCIYTVVPTDSFIHLFLALFSFLSSSSGTQWFREVKCSLFSFVITFIFFIIADAMPPRGNIGTARARRRQRMTTRQYYTGICIAPRLTLSLKTISCSRPKSHVGLSISNSTILNLSSPRVLSNLALLSLPFGLLLQYCPIEFYQRAKFEFFTLTNSQE